MLRHFWTTEFSGRQMNLLLREKNAILTRGFDTSRIGEGNGHGKGLVDLQEIGDNCILVIPNPLKPPRQNELHVAPADVMQKWLAQHPVRVRATLPITNQGRRWLLSCVVCDEMTECRLVTVA